MFEFFQKIRMQMLLTAVLTLILGIMLTVMPGIAIETLFLILSYGFW